MNTHTRNSVIPPWTSKESGKVISVPQGNAHQGYPEVDVTAGQTSSRDYQQKDVCALLDPNTCE